VFPCAPKRIESGIAFAAQSSNVDADSVRQFRLRLSLSASETPDVRAHNFVPVQKWPRISAAISSATRRGFRLCRNERIVFSPLNSWRQR